MDADQQPPETPEAIVTTNAFPDVAVRRQRMPSPVWLIPLAAVLVGLWLLFQYWQQRGETITVRFPSAEGIQAGSTEVRYKAVSVGKVKQVTLDEELNPLVTLSLDKSISGVLDCSAQFWVVRPRIRGAEISGIGTLFSGTYVGMLPQRADDQEKISDSPLCYEVLDGAPVRRPERPGREFTLITDSMGSLDIGTPVYFKQLQVGEIINYRLSQESGKIEIGIFLYQPYYRFVNANTRFWNVSGAEFKMDSVGAEFRMESLTSLMVGGIAFNTPKSELLSKLPVSAEGDIFELYEDFDSSQEKRYTDRLYYTLYFNGSLRGLSEDAPVEFQGIRVGKVEKIKMHLDSKSLDVRIPVLISIEPQRFSEDIRLDEAPGFMRDMVARGMRGKLQTGNLLTGQRYIAMAFDENAPPDEIRDGQFYAVFPTSPTPVEELSKLAMGVAEDVKITLGSISSFMESKQLDTTVDNLNRVLQETEKTVVDARKVIAQLDDETLPVLTRNIDQVGTEASKVLQQVDEQTLPALTRNVNQVGADASRIAQQLEKQTLPGVNRVLKRVDEQTLPTLARNVNQVGADASRIAQQLEKQTLPGVNRVLKRVDEQTLPTLARNVNQVSEQAGQVMQRLDQQTLPAVARLSNTASDSVTRMTGTVNKAATDFSRTTHELNKTMVRLQNTLGHLDRLLARNSPTQYQLQETLEEVTAMARSVRILTEQLERQPESVIRGRSGLK